jgi:hypothetical protein
MRPAKYDLHSLEAQAQQEFSDWVAQYRLVLARASTEERANLVAKGIAEVALAETPRSRRDLFELTKDFSDAHFHLATEPLPGYPSDAVGILAACVYEWLKLRLDTYWEQKILFSIAAGYLDFPGHCFLVRQDKFGWKEVYFQKDDVPNLLRMLANMLLRESESGSNEAYRIVYTAPQEQNLLEVKLERNDSYYTAPEGAETEYHVWSRNWNHNAGPYFELAQALLVSELLRITREFETEVSQRFGRETVITIVDEGVKPLRDVWAVTVTIGSGIDAQPDF